MSTSIAFDWGGVLATDGSQLAWRVLEDELGVPAAASEALWYNKLQRLADRGEIDEATIWESLAKLRERTRPNDIRRIFLDQYVAIPHGIECLRAARSAGWQVVLATNNVRSWLDSWSERYDWFDLFDAICCSSDIGAAKPEPAFYERLRELTGADARYFVDDKLENTIAAEQAGFQAILADPNDAWQIPKELHALNQ